MALHERQIDPPKLAWPLRLPAKADPQAIRRRIAELTNGAQYGWGHSIDFGTFRIDGLLGEHYLQILGALHELGWLPRDIDGQRVADIGCYTGGVALYLAHIGAAQVYAIDEVVGNLDQCRYLAEVYAKPQVETIDASIYHLTRHIAQGSLDIVACFGVLYHLSDMLLGLYVMRELLKEGGLLLLETNAVNNAKESYANFGRFYAGMWWQPTTLCVRDMLEFMGFVDIDIVVHQPSRCLAKACRASGDLRFKRGINWHFPSIRDLEARSLDPTIMAPAGSSGR